jgi:hypothetical protein
MKTVILFALTLAAAAHAQQPVPCLELKQVKVGHRVLYQGGTADIKLKFEAMKSGPQNCRVLAESPALGHQLPALEIQDAPGMSAKVGPVGALRFDQPSSATLKAREISATVALTASLDAIPGEHKLAGSVRYKVINSQGDVSDEVLSFDVPIKVEPARAGANAQSFPRRHPVWAKVLLPFEIVALIALLPLIVIAGITGWDGC